MLDARNLMERGDYTGAVRRATSAIEAVVEWRLREELTKQHSEADVDRRLAASENDFPGRLRQLCKLMGPSAPSGTLLDEFEETRRVRHDIVHRSRRLTSSEKGRAQRAVDTGRWLFNRIEGKPEREAVRERGLLRSVGRSSMAPRFVTRVGSRGVEVEQPKASSDLV